MGIFSMLFGKKKEIECKKCGKKGIAFLENGAYNGQFRMLGKNDEAKLITKCKDCGQKYIWDTLWGSIKEYDELKEIAKKKFGIGIKD